MVLLFDTLPFVGLKRLPSLGRREYEMPPKPKTRNFFCTGVYDVDGNQYLAEREPYRYRVRPDNRIHTVVQGDTLFSLADKYFRPLERACGFWWVIADYQNPPIIDPSIELVPGSKIVIPSLTTLNEMILSEFRRREF